MFSTRETAIVPIFPLSRVIRIHRFVDVADANDAGFMKKQALIKRYMRSRSSSMTDLSRHPRTNSEDDTDFLRRAIEKAQATLNGPKPLQPLTPSINQLQFRYRTKDNELEQRLRRPPLPSDLPPEDDAKVTALLNKRGIISKYAKEQVGDQDILRLKPRQWLNDEVINFYGALILGRSDSCKENPTTNGNSVKGKKPLDVHYFSTFFWTKLEKEGYEKGRLAKWTKKIDIFSKDAILIPVNHANIHWTGAAINFRKKRIESYDSMHDDRGRVFKLLRQYVDLEHRNKKKTPFDFSGWEDYTSDDTPRQENGFDCGVFTCQFLESLSRGEESFNFSQKDIPYLRRRMIWEIGNATLRTEV
ncbi:cysteine proteinase [Mycena maculata]|uniref:Cysteine proteinase n=1 Tax=Mycena maculata TaxID=230809 RepID=A0AAD7KDN8_9AGAR|nr:cysteine proteinase [Mycena maculata]